MSKFVKITKSIIREEIVYLEIDDTGLNENQIHSIALGQNFEDERIISGCSEESPEREYVVSVIED